MARDRQEKWAESSPNDPYQTSFFFSPLSELKFQSEETWVVDLLFWGF